MSKSEVIALPALRYSNLHTDAYHCCSDFPIFTNAYLSLTACILPAIINDPIIHTDRQKIIRKVYNNAFKLS